jgi:hypothetical protein
VWGYKLKRIATHVWVGGNIKWIDGLQR